MRSKYHYRTLSLVALALMTFSAGCHDSAPSSQKQTLSTSMKRRCADMIHSAEPHECLDTCLKEAAQGNLAAEAALGDLFRKTRQWTEAMEWYRLAAMHGSLSAQAQLAQLYWSGEAGPKDIVKGRYWGERAAEGGLALAQLQLARHYHQTAQSLLESQQAFQWYQRCATSFPEAAFETGLALMLGELGQEKNLEQAVSYLLYAAEKKHPPAQQFLAKLQSNSVSEDRIDATIQQYHASAMAGEVNAQIALAKAFMKQEKPQYDKMAIYWLQRAADQAHRDAILLLSDCYYLGIGTEVNYEMALKNYKQYAIDGDPYAQYRLGQMYCYGYGVKQDLSTGRQWLEYAWEQGFEQAKQALDIDYPVVTEDDSQEYDNIEELSENQHEPILADR